MPWRRIVTILIFVFLLAALLLSQASRTTSDKYTYAEIGQKTYLLEIADESSERQKGLSDRPSLGRNMGMLFIFESPARLSFWMKDMRFALDFIWLRHDQVVRLDENVPPPAGPADEPARINPFAKIDKVIELAAGEIKKSGVKIGDLVRLTGVRPQL